MDNLKSAVILAGGRSRRMGFDKQFLKINERRLIDSMVNRLKEEFDEIIIVTNKPWHYMGVGHKVVSDIIKDKGPLSGIHAGLKASSSRYVYFIACDMPYINLNYIKYMKENLYTTKASCCITKLGDWIEPFNAFYSKDTIKDIEEHLNQNKKSVHSLVKKLNTLYIEENTARSFSPNWDMFLNLNTKEDLQQYMDAGFYKVK